MSVSNTMFEASWRRAFMDAFSSSTLALVSHKRSLFYAESDARRFDAGMVGISRAMAASILAANDGLALA